MQRAAALIRILPGWRRFALAFLLGVGAGFAFPPFNALALFFLALPAFFFLLRGAARARDAFALGWLFAFGQLIVCLHWVAGALFVDVARFGWMVPFAVAGLPAFFALWYGLAAALAHRAGLQRPFAPLVLAALWFFAEAARGLLFTGFPWDLAGAIWADFLPILQLASLFGIYGLTLATLLLAFGLAVFFTNAPSRFLRMAVAVGILLFMGGGVWGAARLEHTPTDYVPDVRLRLVQPETDQRVKWNPGERDRLFQELIALSFPKPVDPKALPVTHIIWPETATAWRLAEDLPHRRAIAANLAPGQMLLTGVVRRAAGEDGATRWYNSLVALDPKAQVVAGYDKAHLVPFGEYVPFRGILPVEKITAGLEDFSPGDGPRTLRVAGLPPFSPLICYEAIFSGAVVARDDPPRFLLNVTNDAWYRGTIGPAQHFALARLRAVEEGLPLIRVANGGTTAIVDPLGRVVASRGEESPGIVEGGLPSPLEGGTAFGRLAGWWGRLTRPPGK